MFLLQEYRNRCCNNLKFKLYWRQCNLDPNQLQEKQLYFKSKILAVADVVEAMSSHRPYRPARGVERALVEIKTGKGTLFDSDVVDACIKLFQDNKFTFDDADLEVATWSLAIRAFLT